MHTIKQILEDFIVHELPVYETDPNGIYSYFMLKKKACNTYDAVRMIAEFLKIPVKNIGFAGTKDKKAVTEQIISIKSADNEKIKQLKFETIFLNYLGKGAKPVSLGDLEGNHFTITVRNLESESISMHQIINLFGSQRFSKNNAEIGKMIVKKEFGKAAQLIEDAAVKEHLSSSPNDCIGALRKIPLKIRKMYVHAYQSQLWNRTAKKLVSKGVDDNIKVPMIGYSLELNDCNPETREILQEIMNKEGITGKEFIINEIKELSSEGGQRALFVKPKDFKISFGKDELNKEKKKAVLCFFLPKGSYATVVIDSLFQ